MLWLVLLLAYQRVGGNGSCGLSLNSVLLYECCRENRLEDFRIKDAWVYGLLELFRLFVVISYSYLVALVSVIKLGKLDSFGE